MSINKEQMILLRNEMREAIGTDNIGRDLYMAFFARLYQKSPEMIFDLVNNFPSFRRNEAKNSKPRIDIGKYEDIHIHNQQPGNRPNYKTYDRFPIDESKQIWLMTCNNPSMAFDKIILICNRFNISFSEAKTLLFGSEATDGSITVTASTETTTDNPDLQDNNAQETKNVPSNKSTNTNDTVDPLVTGNDLKAENNTEKTSFPEPQHIIITAKKVDAENETSIFASIDSSLAELQKQMNVAIAEGNSGLVSIAIKIEKLQTAKKELLETINKIKQLLSE